MARLTLSSETKDLLEKLSDENHLSVVKRKGLVEHLIRTSQQPKGQHEAYGPRQRPFIRRSKTSLDNLTVLRKKETIIKSGAYERSQIAPPKGKEISDKEKDKLIHQMAYNCDPPNLPKLEDMLKSRRGNRIEIDITPRSREGELVREIEERREFLEEMQKLGAPNFRQHEGMVRNEIAVKEDELERLRYELVDQCHDM